MMAIIQWWLFHDQSIYHFVLSFPQNLLMTFEQEKISSTYQWNEIWLNPCIDLLRMKMWMKMIMVCVETIIKFPHGFDLHHMHTHIIHFHIYDSRKRNTCAHTTHIRGMARLWSKISVYTKRIMRRQFHGHFLWTNNKWIVYHEG